MIYGYAMEEYSIASVDMLKKKKKKKYKEECSISSSSFLRRILKMLKILM